MPVPELWRDMWLESRHHFLTLVQVVSLHISERQLADTSPFPGQPRFSHLFWLPLATLDFDEIAAECVGELILHERADPTIAELQLNDGEVYAHPTAVEVIREVVAECLSCAAGAETEEAITALDLDSVLNARLLDIQKASAKRLFARVKRELFLLDKEYDLPEPVIETDTSLSIVTDESGRLENDPDESAEDLDPELVKLCEAETHRFMAMNSGKLPSANEIYRRVGGTRTTTLNAAKLVKKQIEIDRTSSSTGSA